MLDAKPYSLCVGLIILISLARPALAFGAGNIAGISKIEGQNWRHGDIEDALLTLTMARALSGKKFNKLQVSRVYFGNWLRDYSQAVDVGTVKSVSAEAIRLLLSVLGFLTFGYGSGEFEVTMDRLGCYRPEEHIDNPKDYAENEDARRYHPHLRGPVNEDIELAIDEETGLKNYIANEHLDIVTSAGHCRKLLRRAIELGRKYRRDGHKPDKYECLRLMGTALHCLEDYYAHSNFIELALIEMGERDVFPHVGRDTKISIPGVRHEVYPIVTGTFGGVDFLHSVTGEVSDKLTQNEIEELADTLEHSQNNDTSKLRELLDMIPDGIFGGKHQSSRIDDIQNNANAAQMEGLQVSPREPEAYTEYIGQIFQQIMPAIEFHDEIIKSISKAMDRIPVIPKVLEQLSEQLSRFVFSNIAPFILPVIQQIQAELRVGSDEIIASSKQQQHIVFHDDRCTDPTHSMVSKDHFSNILNEIGGRCAAYMVRWAVPQIMEVMDDENADIDRVCTRIIYSVLSHPAQRHMGDDGIPEGRQMLFDCVKEWWNERDERMKDDFRQHLSREGVEEGHNHKEGVYDTGHGHGCVGKLKMRKQFGEPETLEDKIASHAANAILEGASGVFSGFVKQASGVDVLQYKGEKKEKSSPGGGLLGMASSILGGVLSKEEDDNRRESNSHPSYSQSSSCNQYSQPSYQSSTYGSGANPDYNSYGGSWQEQSSYEQSSHGHRRDKDDSGSYGRRRNNNEDNSYSQSSYSRRHNEEVSESYGRSSYSRHEDKGEYGYDSHGQSSYERCRSGDGDNESGSYGHSSYDRREHKSSYGSRGKDSYGGEHSGSEYGNQRYKKDDDSGSDSDSKKKKKKKTKSHRRRESDSDDSSDDKHLRYGRRDDGSSDEQYLRYGHHGDGDDGYRRRW